MAVRWVRCLVPFQTLSKTDQQLLLQESWKELFLLNFAQWSVPWDLASLFDSPQVRERIPDDSTTTMEMKTVQEILCRFRQLSPDSSEVGCMKAVILFSPGEIDWILKFLNFQKIIKFKFKQFFEPFTLFTFVNCIQIVNGAL